ncbi:hypothetical protein OH710_06680 [Pseudomonas capsici]|uniref:hypothetical protein n=1 Tax=Pseudomonas capsici TaxID=2810614 RepID=UPI0021F15E14|nr:hypothetical protein [Pseudomonas capsici]MCV4272324.1 hypothetical protein [Pseudomonas capsici]
MSESIVVHACSTLCNPDRLSKQQLRVELNRANEELFSKDLLIIEAKNQVCALNDFLIKLAKLQLDGNTDQIQAEIQALANRYQQIQAQAEVKVH